jgi:hypothetical protein
MIEPAITMKSAPANFPLGIIRRGRKRQFGSIIIAVFGVGILVWPATASLSQKRNRLFLSYEDARPILETLADRLPEELQKGLRDKGPSFWSDWLKRHDGEIRARLIRGDEDSLINFLLFGTSFTRQPRVTAKTLEPLMEKEESGGQREASELVGQVIERRIADLLRALRAPGSNERLVFLRRFLQQRGQTPDTSEGRRRLRGYLLLILHRFLQEQQSYQQALEKARLSGNSTEEFAARSQLYRTRGLSPDTSLLPNRAVEESLQALRDRNFLGRATVRRVAVIGPGLDFVDKQEGYDFYPLQSLQPFAIIESLLRLDLADREQLQVVCFDINHRVIAHLSQARARARRGLGYTVQLPWNPLAPWRPETVSYWKKFGEMIGHPVSPVKAPSALADLQIRAVRIRPDVVLRVTSFDMNIVTERYALAPGERFDLVIATNVFVYYDVVDQSLALANIEQMVRPGGFLLSNNALLELSALHMRSVGYRTVVYSDRPDDGDHIVWYQRQPDR